MIYSQKYFQSKNSSTNFTLFWNGSFFLASLSMWGWLEKTIHFIKRHSMRIQLYNIKKKIFKKSVCLGGWGVAGAIWGCMFSCFQLGWVWVLCACAAWKLVLSSWIGDLWVHLGVYGECIGKAATAHVLVSSVKQSSLHDNLIKTV